MDYFDLRKDSTDEIKDRLGWQSGLAVEDLTSVLMVALERIARLEARVDDLSKQVPSGVTEEP